MPDNSRGAQAYRARNRDAKAGLTSSWSDIADLVGYADRAAAYNGARAWARSQELPWPVGASARHAAGPRDQVVYETLVELSSTTGIAVTQLTRSAARHARAIGAGWPPKMVDPHG